MSRLPTFVVIGTPKAPTTAPYPLEYLVCDKKGMSLASDKNVTTVSPL